MDTNQLREILCKKGILKDELDTNPVRQFANWFNVVLSTDIIEPNAMVLTTVENNSPWQRTVLLKQFNENGFIFYTNYESHKAMQIAENDEVSVLFPWYALGRQVIIKGQANKTDDKLSEGYFQSRSRGSQVGAWASRQSRPLQSRQELVERVEHINTKFAGQEVLPLPPFWGGYQITPYRYEFWQGRDDRLHDRFVYERSAQNWSITQLFP